MKALLTLKSAINQSSVLAAIALTFIAPFAYPALLAKAQELQTSGKSAVVFKINSNLQNQNSLSYSQLADQDPLTQKLKQYLTDKQSPLADYTSELLAKTNWKTILAISYVESKMGVHHYFYNSSGIGGQQYLRKYKNYGEWIDDMSAVLDTHYNGWSLDKMNCVYVQPCSRNWAYGSKMILGQLTDLEKEASAERAAVAQTAMNGKAAELAMLTK